MTRRKPLVLVDGVPTQLPEGDSLAGGGAPSLPITRNGGSIVFLPLVGSELFSLQVLKADGSIVLVDARAT